ncbi:hypothetical protein AB1Y20_004821 [Prymnesium parvum]|uniref:inosine/xanthosine triphosphatase n=1 Tax=Prymnesium parvum TaxID=97485 RepID=A0AB34IX86_PRYPA
MRLLAVAAAGAAALFFGALLRRSRGARAPPRVLVASTAGAKLVAVERALGGRVHGVKTDSLVAEQPVGVEETAQGARNRMRALLADETLVPTFSHAVAIENGLVRAATNGSVDDPAEVWVDLAVVCVRDLRTGAEVFSTSAGLQFPSESVAEWAECGQEGTVGAVLAAGVGCDKQDPHAFLTCGAFSRADLLEHAIKVAAAALSSRGSGSSATRN